MAAGGFGVERKLELLVPIEKETRVGERIVAVARAGAVTRDVGGMRGDFVGDALPASRLRHWAGRDALSA